jgi:hypothetical protein
MAAAQLLPEDSESHEDRPQRGDQTTLDPRRSAAPQRVIVVLDPRTGELVALPASNIAALWSHEP